MLDIEGIKELKEVLDYKLETMETLNKEIGKIFNEIMTIHEYSEYTGSRSNDLYEDLEGIDSQLLREKNFFDMKDVSELLGAYIKKEETYQKHKNNAIKGNM